MSGKAVWGWALRVTLVLAVGFLLLGAKPLYAQIDTGSILGTVSDASGAPIHGANVTLTNEGTNAELSTTTGSDGSFKFTPVKIGSYKLTATYVGFQTT